MSTMRICFSWVFVMGMQLHDENEISHILLELTAEDPFYRTKGMGFLSLEEDLDG